MKSGDRWRCVNPACGCEVFVEASATIEGSNPRCSCGGVMKKKYEPPKLTHVEVLALPQVLRPNSVQD